MKYSSKEYAAGLLDIELQRVTFIELESKLIWANSSTEGSIVVTAKREVELKVDDREKILVAFDKYSFVGHIDTKEIFAIRVVILASFSFQNEPQQEFRNVF